jgi:FkbM family methyltransferase
LQIAGGFGQPFPSAILLMKPLKGIFYRDWDNDHVGDILKEIFWERLYFPLVEDKKDLTIVDVGANIGMFTLWMYPFSKKIYSVEPSAVHLETLRKMIEFNGLDRVEVIPVALSNKDGTADFYHNENTTAFSLTPGKGEKETVKTVTIGNLTKDIEHVDILKVDVEGAEGTLFSHPSFDEVAKKTDQIIVEYHNWCGITPALLMNTVRDRGYNVVTLPTEATVLWFRKV